MRWHRLLDPVFYGILARLKRPAPSGLLLISGGGLGDTIMLSVVLPRFLALAEESETVTVLLRSDSAKMAFVLPKNVAVRVVDFRRLRRPHYRWRIFRELHAANYRQVIHTDYLRHPDLDEALVAACAAPEAAAMEPRPSRKFAARLSRNRGLYSRLYDSGPPRVDKVLRWAGFADFLNGTHSPPPVMCLPADSVPDAVAQPAPTVVFQPFSAVTLKQSPPDLWRDIAGSLPAGWRVKLAGHPSDLERNPEFRCLLDLPNVEFEGAPFAQLAGIIRGSALVISVDTACMHLAAVLGVPTLCLASAAYVGEIVPYAPEIMPANLRVVYTQMECQGCLGQCEFPPENGMYPCVAALDREAVLTAVRILRDGRCATSSG